MARQSQIQFTIPEPCNIPWKGMHPVDTDQRYCSSCDKVVTDFSKMSDDELMLYFKHNQGKTCGLFAKNQLGRSITLLPEKSQKVGWWKMILFIPLSLLSKSAKAQYYDVANGNKQSDSISFANDSIKSKPIIAETNIDSTKNVDSTQNISPVSADSLKEKIGENSNNSDDSLLTIKNVGPQEIFSEEIIVLSGDVVQTTTLGLCSMPLLPNNPDVSTGSFWDRLFPTFEKNTPPIQKIEKLDPQKELSDKPLEKPKPQQPALPASNEIAAIMPEERKKWWRS